MDDHASLWAVSHLILTMIKIAVIALSLPAFADIQRAPYHLLYAALEHLAGEQEGWADTINYGQTPGGRSLLAIKLYLPDSKQSQRNAVLITGAIHGNEYLGIEHRLAAWMLVNRKKIKQIRTFIEHGGIIYLVPITNPDGYERNRRTNNYGIDLNRDFHFTNNSANSFRQPESRALADWLDKDLRNSQAKLALSVDYHCCASAILYPWNHHAAKLGESELSAHLKIGQLIQASFDPSYILGASSEVLNYESKGTAKDYYHAKYGALAFTFEGKNPDLESKQFPRHQRWWLDVFGELVPKT